MNKKIAVTAASGFAAVGIIAGVGSAGTTTSTGTSPAVLTAARVATCHASANPVHPAQNSTVKINVHTVGRGHVKASASYKTTTTTHFATAGPGGNATVPFNIGRATVGFRVVVHVTVTKRGFTAGHCSASFTPVK